MLELSPAVEGVRIAGAPCARLESENALKISKNRKPPGQLMLHTTEGNVGNADKTNRPPERYKYRHEERGA